MKLVTGAILVLGGALLLAGRVPEAGHQSESIEAAAADLDGLAEIFALPEGHPPIEGWQHPALPEGHPAIPELGSECPRNSLGADPRFDDEVYIVSKPPKVIST